MNAKLYVDFIKQLCSHVVTLLPGLITKHRPEPNPNPDRNPNPDPIQNLTVTIPPPPTIPTRFRT